jgi:glycosyltransferase involved in cell wall biosynthesis
MSASHSPVLLQVLPALRSGGVERGTIDIANAAAAAGFTSIVASAGGGMEAKLSKNVKHILLPLNKKGYFALKSNAKLLQKLIEEHEVDIVHARSRGPAWSAWWALQKSSHPAHFLTTFHGTYGLSGLFKKAYNRVMLKGERVIAVSRFIREHIMANYGLNGVELNKITVIHRGVDLDIFNTDAVSTERLLGMVANLKLPDDVPIIMLPGRITEWKGQLLLVEALKQLPHRDFYCMLVGDDVREGNYRKKLFRTIDKAGLRANVRVMDPIADIVAAYMLSDVVVSASTKPEAFGRVAVEAQAMGRMLVATDHGGSSETVIPNRTGWLVKPNDPKAMAAAIEEALNLTKDERKERADAAIAHVRAHFSLPRMCELTLEVYRDLMNQPIPVITSSKEPAPARQKKLPEEATV